MKKKRYLKEQYKLFLESFKKINAKFFLILFFDLAFYFIAFLIISAAGQIIVNQLDAFDQGSLSNSLLASEDGAKEVLGTLQFLLLTIAGIPILTLIAVIILYTVFKGIVWSYTVNRKINFSYFKKLFFLNISWFVPFFIILFFFAFAFRENTLTGWFFALALIWVYFTNIIYVKFTKKEGFSSVKSAFKTGIKIHKFLFPYAVLIAVLGIVFLLNRLITFLLPNLEGVGSSIIAIIFLIYLAWARFYLVLTVENVK